MHTIGAEREGVNVGTEIRVATGRTCELPAHLLLVGAAGDDKLEATVAAYLVLA